MPSDLKSTLMHSQIHYYECTEIKLYSKYVFYCVSLKVIGRTPTMNQPIVFFEPLNQANSRFGLLHTARFMPEKRSGESGWFVSMAARVQKKLSRSSYKVKEDCGDSVDMSVALSMNRASSRSLYTPCVLYSALEMRWKSSVLGLKRSSGKCQSDCYHLNGPANHLIHSSLITSNCAFMCRIRLSGI